MPSLVLWGPPGHRQDHDRAPARAARRVRVRAALRGDVGREGRAGGHRAARRTGRRGASRRSSSWTRSTASTRPSRTPSCRTSRTARSCSSARRRRTPGFSLIRALLSRVRVVVLEPLGDEALARVLDRALAEDDRGLGGRDRPGRRGARRAARGRRRRRAQAPERAGVGGRAGRGRRGRHRDARARVGGRPDDAGGLRRVRRRPLRPALRLPQVAARHRRRRRPVLDGAHARGRARTRSSSCGG